MKKTKSGKIREKKSRIKNGEEYQVEGNFIHP